MIIVLLGPHGVGKTTLGRALERELGWPFHDEIGRRLAADPSLRPAGRSAEAPQLEFDLRVFAEELARDVAFDHAERGPRIVESWHFANIAYAARRSPSVAAAMLAHTRVAVGRQPVYVVPLRATDALLDERHTEPGSPTFFRRVARNAWRLAIALGGHPLPPVHTDEGTPEELATLMAPHLRTLARETKVEAATRPGLPV